MLPPVPGRERTGLTEDETRAGTGAVLAALREALGEDDYGHIVLL